jgi:hypothetical protein
MWLGMYRSDELTREFCSIPMRRTMHAETTLAGIEKIGVADNVAVNFVCQPFDQGSRTFTEKVGHESTAGIMVFIEDIRGHE